MSTNVMNTIEINGYKANIQYNTKTGMFRGEFVGLNGSADFYAKHFSELRKEGEISLKVFLDMCQEDEVQTRKTQIFKHSIETSNHFQCSVCSEWWSVEDAPTRPHWFCTWCGEKLEEDKTT